MKRPKSQSAGARLSADASLMPVFAERAKMVDERESVLTRQALEERDYQKAVEQAKAGYPARYFSNFSWHATPSFGVRR